LGTHMSYAQTRQNANSQQTENCVCPHCWFDFQPANALFVATHPELIGDEVLGDHQFKRLKRSEVQIINGRALDRKGFPCTDRACPRCRLQIPVGMLERTPLFVSLAGAPSAGKTYFIASLMHTLRQQLPLEFNLLLEYATSDEINRIENVVNELFRRAPDQPVYLEKTQEAGATVNNVISLNGQRVELPKPFLFSLRPTPNHVNFEKMHEKLHRTMALYDCSGEHFQYGRYRDTSNRSFGHLAKANAVMFVYDPLQDAPAQHRLSALSNDPQVHKQKHASHQEKTLEAVIHQMRILRHLTPKSRIKAPLLIVVQKYDVWYELLPKWAQVSATSTVRLQRDGASRVHIDTINRTSVHIRKFLYDICPMFVSLAEANFEIVRYFPVSAIGTSPIALEIDVGDEYDERKETRLCVLPQNIQPFRVADPILWLFAKLQLVPAARTVNADEGVPSARIVGDFHAGVQVILPDSGQRITLDAQYLGSVISDPYTGAETRVPNASIFKRIKIRIRKIISKINRIWAGFADNLKKLRRLYG
jgi:hypothetical protein